MIEKLNLIAGRAALVSDSETIELCKMINYLVIQLKVIRKDYSETKDSIDGIFEQANKFLNGETVKRRETCHRALQCANTPGGLRCSDNVECPL